MGSLVTLDGVEGVQRGEQAECVKERMKQWEMLEMGGWDDYERGKEDDRECEKSAFQV